MKKSIILVLLTLVLTATGIAQQQLATLKHGDSISVYYGNSALQHAHEAAASGDIINLSSGLFNSTEITKAVSIRGAGMWVLDSLSSPLYASGSESTNTMINGITTFLNPANDTIHSISVEGVHFLDDVTYNDNVSNLSLIKCRIHNFWPNADNVQLLQVQFVNCIIDNYTHYVNGHTSNDSCISFINSVVLGSFESNNAYVLNSIIHIEPTLVNLQRLNGYNSILYYNYGGVSSNGYYCKSGDDYNSNSCFYSIGCNTNTYNPRPYVWSDCNYFDVTNVLGHHLDNERELTSLFKYFDGTYSEGMSFELHDSIAATYLGNDGTQVGIYGGLMPFDPRVSSPVIKRINVAQRTTADGKLSVDIEVAPSNGNGTNE